MAAPDGGWGWMIVLGVSIMNFSVLPLIVTFGLLFEEKFKDLGILFAKTSLLLHLSAAITCISGIVATLLLHKFSFRKVALLGCTVMCIGIIATSEAGSYTAFIICYCLLVGLGHGLLIPTTSVAVNTYFSERRNTATGLHIGAIGLCQVVSPLFVDGLLNEYSVSGTGLILGAIALNSLAGAALLRPLLRVSDKEQETSVLLDKEKQIGDCGSRTNGPRIHIHEQVKCPASIRLTYDSEATDSHDAETTSVQHLCCDKGEGSKSGDIDKVPADESPEGNVTTMPEYAPPADLLPRRNPKKSSLKSEEDGTLRTATDSEGTPLPGDEAMFRQVDGAVSCTNPPAVPVRSGKTVGGYLSSALSLSLLRDGVFLNIMLGMALAFVAELNFNVMFPFILSDYMKLPRSDVAVVMTVLASVDVVSRFLIPLAADKWKWNVRFLFVVSLVGTSVGRTILNNFDKSYEMVLGLSVLFGVSKGLKAVFQALILPNHVSLEELAAATGIVMVSNGLMSLALGPILGVIRDYSKDYSLSLDVTSCLSMSCVLLWAAEGILCRRRVRGNEEARCNKHSVDPDRA